MFFLPTSFGDISDEEMSEKMYRRCREVGINFINCANVYAGSRSEALLGKNIAPEREEVIITSKENFSTGEDINARGANRQHITLEVEKNLCRLGTA